MAEHCKSIEVWANKWVVRFFWTDRRGGRSVDEPFWTIGNFSVGMDVVELLILLGHTVRVYTDDPEVAQAPVADITIELVTED